MRKLIIALTLAGLVTLATAAPAFAGNGPPCSDPGNGNWAAAAVDPGQSGGKWWGMASGKCGNTWSVRSKIMPVPGLCRGD